MQFIVSAAFAIIAMALLHFFHVPFIIAFVAVLLGGLSAMSAGLD